MLDLTYETPKPKMIAGAKHDWELVIGMEVHAQVSSQAKLFSGASTQFGAEPNANVAFVDAAMPGMLPVINEYCIEQAVRTGLGLKAQINLKSAFDRKNYFYPDLPQGYQISQFAHPIVGEGEIEVDVEPAHGGDAYAFPCRIERLHLEQDAGKSIHDMDPSSTYVDLNRSGVALMEIVSMPDIRTPAEAAAYVKKLRAIVIALGTCDGDMEKGNLRADVNVSVCRPGQYEKYMETQDFSHLGTRCEIKNMNSMRFIQAAIDYEARRQIAIVEDGGEVVQETRLYDPDKNETRSMRSKEEAHDYRYFPCPDLLPLEIEQAWVDGIKATLPELPDEKKARFVKDFGLSEYDAGVLTADTTNASFFEEVVATAGDGKGAANWVINELFGRLKKDDRDIADSPISADMLAGMLKRMADNTISGKLAKEVFEAMLNGEGDADTIIDRKGLRQITDDSAIVSIIEQVMAANPKQLEDFRGGKDKLFGFFVGQVMKASQGKANPDAVNRLLKEKLPG